MTKNIKNLLFLLFIKVGTFSTKTYYFKETLTILHYKQNKNNKNKIYYFRNALNILYDEIYLLIVTIFEKITHYFWLL